MPIRWICIRWTALNEEAFTKLNVKLKNLLLKLLFLFLPLEGKLIMSSNEDLMTYFSIAANPAQIELQKCKETAID